MTRVLFSPSISLELRNEDSQMQSFFGELNGIYWRAGTAQSTRPVSTSMRRNSNTGAARSRVGFNPDTAALHLNGGENPNPTGFNGNHICVEVDDHSRTILKTPIITMPLFIVISSYQLIGGRFQVLLLQSGMLLIAVKFTSLIGSRFVRRNTLLVPT